MGEGDDKNQALPLIGLLPPFCAFCLQMLPLLFAYGAVHTNTTCPFISTLLKCSAPVGTLQYLGLLIFTETHSNQHCSLVPVRHQNNVHRITCIVPKDSPQALPICVRSSAAMHCVGSFSRILALFQSLLPWLSPSPAIFECIHLTV